MLLQLVSVLVLIVFVATIVLLTDMLGASMAQIVSMAPVQLALELAVVLQSQTVSVVLLGFWMDNLRRESE